MIRRLLTRRTKRDRKEGRRERRREAKAPLNTKTDPEASQGKKEEQ